MRFGLGSRGWSYAVAVGGIALALTLGVRGVAQSLTAPGDVKLVTDSNSYDIGETIVFNGELGFALGELATTTAVRLQISGPQLVSTNIPLLEGSHDLSGSVGVPGQLNVDVTFSGVSAIGVGTSLFKGLTDGAKINVRVEWTPDQVAISVGAYTANLTADVEGVDAPLISSQAQFTIVEEPSPIAVSEGGTSPATRTPTRTARPTRTPTRTAAPTVTATPTATSTAEPAATATASPTSSPTASPKPSPLPTRTSAPSPAPTATPAATKVSTATPAATRASSPTPTATVSPTQVPTSTPIAFAFASLPSEGSAGGPSFAPATPATSQDVVEVQNGARSRTGIIALIVVGIAVGTGLVAVVGLPFLKG